MAPLHRFAGDGKPCVTATPRTAARVATAEMKEIIARRNPVYETYIDGFYR
jgi:hypothetical protein